LPQESSNLPAVCSSLSGYGGICRIHHKRPDAVAYFMMHFPGGFWPIVNKGELAVVYCFIFLFIASRGSGRLSVDALLKKSSA